MTRKLMNIKHKIIIEHKIEQSDLEPSIIWVQKLITYARIESLFNSRQIGNEIAVAKHLVSSSFYRFTIRYSSIINTDMRIIYAGKIYYISKVIQDFDARKYSYLIAEEGVI